MIRETLSVVHRRTMVLARLGAVDYITLLLTSHRSYRLVEHLGVEHLGPEIGPQIWQ